MILRQAEGDRRDAYLGRQPSRKAVITVPAYFNDAQRQATNSATPGSHRRPRRSPSSASSTSPLPPALAYGLDKKEGAEDRGVRPRRRHVRHLDPRDLDGRRVPGEVDERRHAPRRRRLRPEVLINLIADEFKKENGDRPPQRSAWPSSASRRSAREGEARALLVAARRPSTCPSSRSHASGRSIRSISSAT